MRTALVILLVPHILIGCTTNDGDRPEEAYGPHLATTYRVTPGLHSVDADEKGSVVAGYTSDTEIDAAVDSAFDAFYAAFPEFYYVNPRVSLTDDYVFWYGSEFMSGLSFGEGSNIVLLALWTRGASSAEPGPCWIKRPPGEYFDVKYTTWRYTKLRLVPALMHELLHCAIGDPSHTDPRWKLIH